MSAARDHRTSSIGPGTTRVLEPCANVLGFYDGRVPDAPRYFVQDNWLDDGAYSLGICSYAVVDDDEALVYDTHISLAHAQAIRGTLERLGVRTFTVVLSHWHADHVAGTGVFSDCEIIANALTRDLLATHRRELEDGRPPIAPLIMPTRVFEGELSLQVGRLDVVLRHADIHSADGTVLLLPDQRVMLAGDTLEDPITYVVEADRLSVHLRDLAEMRHWPVDRILPNHGAPDMIGRGGYAPDLVSAAATYVERLLAQGSGSNRSLRAFMADEFDAGSIIYDPAYERVHTGNIEALKALAQPASPA